MVESFGGEHLAPDCPICLSSACDLGTVKLITYDLPHLILIKPLSEAICPVDWGESGVILEDTSTVRIDAFHLRVCWKERKRKVDRSVLKTVQECRVCLQ